MARGKILLVDDEIEVAGFFQEHLEELGFDVDMAEDGVAGLEAFEKGEYDLVISDMMMPRMIGVEMLKRIKEKSPDQKVVMMTGVKEESMVAKARSFGCLTYLNKPVRIADLEEVIETLFPV